MDDRLPCGSHNLGDAIPNSYFDYTCDDCTLPVVHLEPVNEDETNAG